MRQHLKVLHNLVEHLSRAFTYKGKAAATNRSNTRIMAGEIYNIHTHVVGPCLGVGDYGVYDDDTSRNPLDRDS